MRPRLMAGRALPVRRRRRGRGRCHGRSTQFPAPAATSGCGKSQQRQQAIHVLRALQRHAAVPEMVTYSAAISVCEKGSAAPAGLPSLTCCAAPCHRAGSCRMWFLTGLPSACARRTGSTSRPYISCLRCSVMPSCLMWLSTVLPSACAEVLAAPAGIISPMSVAEPCHRAGCGRQAGRYLLTCSAPPGPRVGSGGSGQVRRCRQLLRASAAVRGHRAGRVCARCCRPRMRAGPVGPAGFAAPTSDAAP